MRIAIAQINPVLGDFKTNALKILDYANRAKERGVDIVVCPETSLFGYHPMDLLERATVVEAELKELKSLIKKLPRDLYIVFGVFTKNKNKAGKPYHNSALVVKNKKIVFQSHKELLPTYGVFDDARHIEPGHLQKGIFKFGGKKILITICEDIWAWPTPKTPYAKNPLKKINKAKVDFIINLSASPFYSGKLKLRERVVGLTAKHFQAPMVYVNMVGAQDELIYDGQSFAVDKNGRPFARAAAFKEDFNVIDFNNKTSDHNILPLPYGESLRQALVLGIRDFIQKTGQEKVHLGLSGGIDSALVASLAVDALGSNKVTAIYLPGPYSANESFELAKKCAKNLNISFFELPITDAYKTLIEALEKTFNLKEFGLTHENLQARLRGLILMAYSNFNKSLLLNTSNKSELAAGYGTLYGDLCGGLSPIGDLTKQQVYELSRLYNKEYELIPEGIITREPSAELRPNQKDSDSLPPYAELDKAVENLIESQKPAKSKVEQFLLNALFKSEFKRWQSPPILKVHEHSFGIGRRMPVAHRAYY